MSLNIDMKIIIPVKFSGVSSNLNSKLLTSWLSCNVLNPGKYSTRIPLARRRFCPSFCRPEMIWTIPIFLPMHRSIGGSRRSYQDTNTESEKTQTYVRWRLMTCSSPIKDKYFHVEFSQSINCFHSIDLILFGHQFGRYVEHLFHCEIFLYSWWNANCLTNSSHEYSWFHYYRHEHSPYHRMFFSVFHHIRRRSFLSVPHLIIHPIQEWSGS